MPLVVARTWRASAPETIEADLAALWRDLADADAPIARAVMSNLIVYRERMQVAGDDAEAVTRGLPLDEIAARHPSRIIVLEHDQDQREPAAPFAAGVAVLTFGPPAARYGVEQIVIRTACAEASLPSILRRFVRGDLPATVWWTEDLSEHPPLDALVTIGRQLIYDSRAWTNLAAGVRALAPLAEDRRIDLADLNWRRLDPIRRALPEALKARTGVIRIVHRRGEAALAALLAGWLVAERGASTDIWESIEEATEDDPVLSVFVGEATPALSGSTARIGGVDIDGIVDELRRLSNDASLCAALLAVAEHLGRGSRA